jgi:hypothetical protein
MTDRAKSRSFASAVYEPEAMDLLLDFGVDVDLPVPASGNKRPIGEVGGHEHHASLLTMPPRSILPSANRKSSYIVVEDEDGVYHVISLEQLIEGDE